jgi:hypothetical protein
MDLGTTTSGATMTEGIKTVLHPVSDLAAKGGYSALLGTPPELQDR